MNETEQFVLEVKKKFGEARPRGDLLGWDLNRFFSSFTRICTYCRVNNCTDLNYSYCNSYEIEPETQPQEFDYVLTFKTSFIVDAYSYHVTRYSKNRRNGRVINLPDCGEVAEFSDVSTAQKAIKQALNAIEQFVQQNGFREVDEHDQDIVIDGVSLELSDVATLGRCLFDDFE